MAVSPHGGELLRGKKSTKHNVPVPIFQITFFFDKREVCLARG